jgi:hypothetical protein
VSPWLVLARFVLACWVARFESDGGPVGMGGRFCSGVLEVWRFDAIAMLCETE